MKQIIEKAINKNGKMIIKKNHTENIFDNETVKRLLKSEEDIEKGRTRKATEVIKELREKYGF